MPEPLNSDNSITMRIRVPNELRAAIRAAAEASGELVEDFVVARLWSAIGARDGRGALHPKPGRAEA